MFLELKSVEVAEQMTLIDFNMFKSIRVLIGLPLMRVDHH